MIKRQRGFSIAEVLTVTVILGILTSAMALVAPAMLKAPAQMQSQVDQVNTAALALYKIRRDFSEGDTSGVMGCTLAPAVSCTALSPGLTSVQAMAVISAESPPGTFNVDTGGPNKGYPQWQAFYIYWLAPDANGQAYNLMRAWEPVSACGCGPISSINGVPQNVTSAMVNSLVTQAVAISPPPILTNYIEQMNLGDSPGSSTIDFELIAGTFSGNAQTQTDFAANTYARN
jgi:prepilin-type N-terminal cleavage/methylation domain-containing protein